VVRVARADDLAPGFLLVTFDLRKADPAAVVDVGAPTDPGSADQARELARQVEELKWHLRDVSERSETTTQELRANNEELQAMNEELRSATEELETSREELQSINEELTTVNQELKSNVDELGRANADLQNLMASTAIATVFLDRELRVTLFTPSAVPIFHCIARRRRPAAPTLAPRLDYPQIGADARRSSTSWCRWSGRCVPAERVPGPRPALTAAARTGSRASCSRSSTSPAARPPRRRCASRRRSSEPSSARPPQAWSTSTSKAADRRQPTLLRDRGLPEAALLGTAIFELVHPDDRARNTRPSSAWSARARRSTWRSATCAGMAASSPSAPRPRRSRTTKAGRRR
jgi:two-component system CheB/CheR fusion protein